MKSYTDLQEGLYDPNIFKAFILAGGPGSGKSYVVKKSTGGTGLKIVNSDDVFERYLKQRSDKDGKIKWSKMTDYQVFNLVRAITNPYHGAFYIFKRKKIRLLSCKISKIKTFIEPGKILLKSKKKFVGCKKGCIQIIKERTDR